MRVQGRLTMCALWYWEHAHPRSASSLSTVFFATPVMRTVERIELPSTRAAITRTRFSVLSLFILTIILERLCIVNTRLVLLCKRPPAGLGRGAVAAAGLLHRPAGG